MLTDDDREEIEEMISDAIDNRQPYASNVWEFLDSNMDGVVFISLFVIIGAIVLIFCR